MMAIIDGRLYDTDKAEKIIGSEEWGVYKTVKGIYLDARSGMGCRPLMKVLSENQVMNILGRLDIEKYIELFGMPEEG